jgi:hypothetical protein
MSNKSKYKNKNTTKKTPLQHKVETALNII